MGREYAPVAAKGDVDDELLGPEEVREVAAGAREVCGRRVAELRDVYRICGSGYGSGNFISLEGGDLSDTFNRGNVFCAYVPEPDAIKA